MKRLLLIVLLALVAFYVAWPAISAWQIYSAVEGNDPATLSRKVDFPSVRDSMRPAVEARISKKIEELKEGGSSTAAIVGQLVGGGLLGQISKVVLESIVTPENMIRMANEPGTLPEKIERIVQSQLGRFGGNTGSSTSPGSGIGSLLGKTRKPAGGSVVTTIKQDGKTVSGGSDADKGGPPKVGLGNIKSFAFAGPLAFDIGFARNAASDKADLTARMEFTEFDWKLSQVVPRFE